MFLSLGSIAVVFALGAIAVWGPQYVVLSRKIQDDTSSSVLKLELDVVFYDLL